MVDVLVARHRAYVPRERCRLAEASFPRGLDDGDQHLLREVFPVLFPGVGSPAGQGPGDQAADPQAGEAVPIQQGAQELGPVLAFRRDRLRLPRISAFRDWILREAEKTSRLA